MAGYTIATPYPTSYGNVTVTAGGVGGYATGGSVLLNTGAGTSSWTTAPNPYVYTTTGDANFGGDVKIQGISITETLAKIQERLAILVPDPARLEKYEALKQAYEHYKLLEALCVEETNPGDSK